MSLDNYEIIRELGRGGMGAVFLANDKRLKRHVAIKVLKIPPGLDASAKEETIDNFKREAVAIANLLHNNIVCVYDIGSQGDVHYIVMELIDGAPLSTLLKHQGHPFSLENTLKISDEICDALIYTHKNKVIHRDIKPENIIYTSKGISKLTDFGIAKFVGEENLHINDVPGTIKGTILYISPEQLQTPESVDGRADMYSFAVSMYEMLTGKLPFDGDNPRDVIMKILTEDPIPPSKIATDLLPHIDSVILKAMSKDPSKRYSDIQEFRDELKNISDFRARYAVQPMKMSEAKTEKTYYNQISIQSYHDVLKYSKIFPEAGQQRLLYEIEMLFHKYMEEYKDNLNYKSNAIDLNAEDDDINPSDLSFESHTNIEDMGKPNSGFIDSFNYLIPKVTQQGHDVVRTMSIPMELVVFLGKINGTNTLKQLIDAHYPEKINDAFNLIYNCTQKNLITLEPKGKPDKPILIGDMMLTLRTVTKFQLDFALKKKRDLDGTPNSKLIGEILLDSGYLTRDKLLHTLKLQHWYRRLFG